MPPSLAPYDTLLPESVSTPTLVDANYVPTENDFKPTIESADPTSLGQGVISWYWKNWKYESAACLLVLSGPVIIFGTLYPHNGQPLPQWPFDVSINSILSVYALVLKASIGIVLTSCIGQLQWKWFALDSRPLYDMVRFDQATRDAGGALNLIWRQRIQQPLTTLGCAITILAVAVDPFVQQLLRPADCSIELPDDGMTADLPVATFFDGTAYVGHFDNNALNNAKEKDIENALYTGTFAPQQDILWQCPTGNCTFSDYGTIGLCNSCEDVSADVLVNFANISEYHPAGIPPGPNIAVHSSYNTSEYVSMSMNMSATQLWFGAPVNVAVAAAEQYPPPLTATSRDDIRDAKLVFGFLIGATVKANGRIDWTNPGNSTCNPESVTESWSCRGYGAATCTIKPCIQVYNATVTAGTFKENLLTTMSGADWGRIRKVDAEDIYLAILDSQCSSQERTDFFPDSELKDRWRPFDFNLTLTGSDSARFAKSFPDNIASLIENGCLHLMSPDILLQSVRDYLRGFVQATSSFMGGGSDDFEIFLLSNFQGPPVIRSIYNWGNTDFERVESTLTNISHSLTTYIRTNGRAPSSDGAKYTKTTQGKVYHYATCLEVKWLWLSFPSALSLLTLLLFFLVIEIARKENTPVWKASPLAWVLRTDGPGDGRFSISGGACEEMQDRARQIAVHLDEMGGPRIGMVDMKDPHLELG